MDQNSLQQIVERLRQANTILVTVNKNPTVDQLAACIGLTLFINKLNKHAAAVFSGAVPSTIAFLQPDKTLEPNTDSLRDFIISLDKAKADKLRYKVEDDVVKIFITPYKTSLSSSDFDFTQGDFNIEAVVALGVTRREDLDEAVIAHGRILHDATVIGVSVGEQKSELGSTNWHEEHSSSLSEMAARLCAQLEPQSFDGQIATAFMTGIISETDRFRNAKTSPQVMQISAQLMAAGANQQLIADKLEEPPVPEPLGPASGGDKADETSDIGENDDIVINEDGSMAIKHEGLDEESPEAAVNTPEISEEPTAPESDNDNEVDQPNDDKNSDEQVSHGRVLSPPDRDSQLTASTTPEHEVVEPSTDGLSIKPASKVPLMSRGKRLEPSKQEDEKAEPELSNKGQEPSAEVKKPEEKSVVDQPGPPTVLPKPIIAEADKVSKTPDLPKLDQIDQSGTLADIEKLIGSTHEAAVPPPDEHTAREKVQEVANSVTPTSFAPTASIGALPGLENLHSKDTAASEQPLVLDPNAPPPVPPPMMPQFFDQTGSAQNPFLNPQK